MENTPTISISSPNKTPNRRRFSLILNNKSQLKEEMYIDFENQNLKSNLEKSVELLMTVKNKLRLYQEIELANNIDWLLNIIIRNKFSDFTSLENGNSELIKFLTGFSQELKPRLSADRISTFKYFSAKSCFIKNISRSSSPSTATDTSVIENNGNLFNLHSFANCGEAEKEKEIFTEISERNFDIFNFNDKHGKDTLSLVSMAIFNNYHHLFVGKVNRATYSKFAQAINYGYLDNSYHNSLHAADVAITLNLMILQGNIIELIEMNNIDIFSIFVAATCHDFKHNGFNNSYHINAQTDIAVMYNDISILENYHISETFKIIYYNEETNVMLGFTNEEKKLIRKIIISSILATDMSAHMKIYSNIKIKVDSLEINNGKNVDKLVKHLEEKDNIGSAQFNNKFKAKGEIFDYLIHCADLAHNTKEFHINRKWTKLLMDEFFAQGDAEKAQNLPVSFLCDRDTTNVNKSQVSFNSGIIIPTFTVLANMFEGLNFIVASAKDNLEKWKELID